MKKIDATRFGLTSRIEIAQISTNHYQIIKNRKSRIIMADGRVILKQVQAIKRIYPNAKVSLKTNAPLCSKTIIYLGRQNIKIINT